MVKEQNRMPGSILGEIPDFPPNFVIVQASAFLDSKFAQDRDHRTPVGESALKQIQTDESSEIYPVRGMNLRQYNAENNDKSDDQTQVTINSHNSLL